MLIFLLIFSLTQNETFYESYELGCNQLKNKQYAEAIVHLEKATQLRADSSETAKTYGVQFVEYLPYHHLAKAYLGLRMPEESRTYLKLAYEQEEHLVKNQAIAGRMEIMQEVLDNWEEAEQPAVVTQVKPKADLAPIIRDLLFEDFDAATKKIKRQISKFPEDKALLEFQKLTNDFLQRYNRQKILEAKERNIQEKLNELRDLASKSEEAGNLEQALRYYFAIKELDSRNAFAESSVRRLSRALAEKGSTEADIQRELNQAKLSVEQMIADQAIHEREKMLLEEENADLVGKLNQLTEQVNVANVNVTWEVKPSAQKNLVASVYISIDANIGLKEVSLWHEEQELKSWPVRNEKESFRVPPLIQHQFETYSPLLTLKVLDINGKEYIDEHPYNFKKPTPLISRQGKRIIALVLTALVLVLFASRQVRKRRAIRERFNPYVAGAPIITENMFYGRQILLKQILNTLHNNSLMIYGERRIGKTSFLHQLNKALPQVDDQVYEFIPVFIDLQGVMEEEFFYTLDHEIYDVLTNRGLEIEPTPKGLESRKFISRLRQSINKLKKTMEKQPKLVMLLDEVDIMNGFSEQTNQQLRSVFMKGFADHIVAVMAGININTQWTSEGSPWYNFFEQIELKPFSRNHVDALITKPVSGVYQFTDDAIEEIMKVTNGKPYLVQKMCLNLISHILTQNKRKITGKDVNYVFEEIKKEFYGAQQL